MKTKSQTLARLKKKIADIENRKTAPPSRAPTMDKATQGKSPKAMASAMRMLANREHSEHELARKLRTRGHTADTVDKVLAECRHHGYLDDQLCAEHYCHQQIAKGYGSLRIRETMAAKGFAPELIDTVVGSEYDETREAQNALNTLRKRSTAFTKVADARKRKAKQYRFLITRGYTSEVAMEVIEQFEEMLRSTFRTG